jgi:hypothetical protein
MKLINLKQDSRMNRKINYKSLKNVTKVKKYFWI